MQKKRQFQRALLLAAFLFFIFGFLTWVNGTLIAFFKKTFELNHFNSYLVTFAYYLSYTLMAIPSSMVLKKIGFKNGMSTGLLIMALGCGLFIPAAKLASYPIFLVGLFTTGIGLTLLQTAINPYVKAVPNASVLWGSPIKSEASSGNWCWVASCCMGQQTSYNRMNLIK